MSLSRHQQKNACSSSYPECDLNNSCMKVDPSTIGSAQAVGGADQETDNNVILEGTDDGRRGRSCGCGNAYSRFVVNYPSVIILLVMGALVAAGAVGFLLYPFPSFDEPTKGFEARGTVLSGRLMAYQRLVEQNDYRQYPVQPAEKQSVEQRSRRSTDNTTRMFYQYCPDDLSNRLRMVYKSTGQPDMFTADVMKAVCQHDQDRFRSQASFENVCSPSDANGSCCPTWSLGHVTALIAGKDSCYDIDEDDVTRLKLLFQECTEYYLSGCFDGDESCNINSENCSTNGVALHSVYHYLTPADFTTAVADNNFDLAFANVLPPLIYGDASYTKVFYENHMGGSSLRGNGIKVVAIGVGFKFDLFGDYIISDSVYIGIGCVFVMLLIWMYVGSFFITIMTMFSMIMSMIFAYFLYYTIFRVPFFGFINIVTAVLIIGVGSDDCFVYVDIWKMTKKEIGGGRDEFVSIFHQSIRHAAATMFVTSFTTSSALFAGIVSSITAVRCFSVFAGCSIIVNFVLTVTWIPAAVMIHEKYFLCDESDDTSCKCGSCWFVVGRLYDRIAKVGSNFFEIYLPIAVRKLRILWIILLVGLGIAGFCVVFVKPQLRLPSNAEFMIFRPSHVLEKYDQVYKELFEFENGDVDLMPALFIWGVEPLDNGNHWDPDSEGVTVLDPSFDSTSLEAQEWLYQFCVDFRNTSFHNDEVGIDEEFCFIDTLRSVLEGPCKNSLTGDDLSPCCNQTDFPYSPALFSQCVVALYGLICQQDKCPPGFRFDDNNNIVAMRVLLQTNIKESQDYNAMSKFWTELNGWTNNKIRHAPVGMSKGWFVSYSGMQLFFFDLQQGLATGAPLSVGVSLAVAACVLLLAIRNVLVTIYAIVSISFSVFVVIGSVVLLGWELNIFESTILSLAVGLSVDFTIHFGVSYRQATGVDRNSRSLFALRTLGAAITMAALTTFIAGACMAPATVLSYVQLGTFLMLVMVVSWLYGVFLFIPLCMTIGPQGSFGQISRSCFSGSRRAADGIEMRADDHAHERTRESAHEQHVDTNDERQ